MIELIKHIWAGSWLVKASVVFLSFVLAICLIGDPGRTIFTGLFIVAVLAIVRRLDSEDNP